MIAGNFYSIALLLLLQIAEIDINGSKVYYEYHDAGSSPTVIFESGARGNVQLWQHILPVLKEEGISYLAYDRPGHGQSEESGNERTLNQISDDLSLLIKKLEIDGDLLLIGHSMGGVYQQYFASVHEDRVKGLVLIDVPHSSWEGQLFSCMSEAQIEDRAISIEDFRRRTTKAFREESVNARSSFEILNGANKPQVPVVVVYGEAQSWPGEMDGDCLTKSWVENQQLHLNTFENAELEVSSESGHMVPIQDPEIVVASIMILIDD